MKRFLLFCLTGMIAVDAHAAMNDSAKAVQPFSAVIWTTNTLHAPSGKAFPFTQRTVYTRDASGNTRSEVYQPTKGLEHDMTGTLERVVTGSTSAKALPHLLSGKETVQEVDLGTSQLSGLLTTGRRQTFQDVNGQRTRTVEMWFCPTLGLTVRMESTSARGDTVLSELSDLHLGKPDLALAEVAPVASPPIPLLLLYRGLFSQIAGMERDRTAIDPPVLINMEEIEDHLQKKLGLSGSDWQVLVDKSVKLEAYTRERSKEARSFADQDRAARKANPGGANTLAAGRATLHTMQQDLNAHVQGEIDELKQIVGPDATARVETYLQGPMAASTSVVLFRSARLRAKQAAAKEQAR